jgi:hypothetical protein
MTLIPAELHNIIENHRAVCTATADQISDLESQINGYIQPMLADARQQLENARGQDALFGRSGFEAGWHERNPALSAAVLDS